MTRRKAWFVFLGMIALAFAIRLLFVQYQYPQWGHGMTLEEEAKNVYHGFGFVFDRTDSSGTTRKIPSVYDVPGYAYLLAWTWKIFKPYGFIYVQVLQCVLDSLSCLLVYFIAKRFVQKKTACIASFLYALYLPEAYFAANVGRDFWGTFGLLIGFALFLKHLEDKKWIWIICIGVTLGMTSYFRPVFLFLPMFWCLALMFSEKRDFFKWVGKAVLMVSVICLVLFPWALRNHRIYGKWIFTRHTFYQAVWGGFGQFKNPVGAMYYEHMNVKNMQDRGYTDNYKVTYNDTFEFEEFVKPYAIQTIKDHPWWYLSTVIRRIPMAIILNRILWGVLQDHHYAYHLIHYQDNHIGTILDYIKKIRVVNPGFLFTKFLDLLVLGLALVGAYLHRVHWRHDLLLWSPLLYLIAVHIPLAVEGRYIVPAHWVYLIFMAFTLNAFYVRLQRRAV